MKGNIIICGDLVPTERNVKFFKNGEVEELIGKELVEEINKSEGIVFNLEVPLTNSIDKIVKNGPNMKAEPETVNGIQGLNPLVITLANNHIMDYGEEGLVDTLTVLKNNCINYIGAGENIKEAERPFFKYIDNQKVGIYACAEHEFSIASYNKPGANPFDYIDGFDKIKKVKEECDRLIVVYHAGKENYRYPTPRLKKVCRKMIEYGADVVTCQQSHCIGAYECYKEGYIVYGQGNFISDYNNSKMWDTSILLRYYPMDNILDFIPISRLNEKICLSKDNTILDSFMQRSREIIDDNLVEDNYQEYADSLLNEYLKSIRGSRFIFKVINKLSGYRLIEQVYTKEHLVRLLNIIECEPHNELVITAIKKRMNK